MTLTKKIFGGMLAIVIFMMAFLVVGGLEVKAGGINMTEIKGAVDVLTMAEKSDISEVMDILKTSENDIDMLAKILYTEARGVKSKTEQAAVAWCVLNRVDNREKTIKQIITAKHQFAWKSKSPIDKKLRALAEDVYLRWIAEKLGYSEVGRILPQEYEYFAGRSGRNWFRKTYKGRSCWDWSLESPYAS